MDDEAAAKILTDLATPTTATFQHLRNLSLDDQGTAGPSQSSHSARQNPADGGETKAQKGRESSNNNNNGFSVFDGLLQHDDILLYLTTQHMEPQELFTLYCISKPFHYIVNSHMTNYILSSARRWARLTHHRPSNDLPEPSTRIKRHPPSAGVPKSRRFTVEHQSASSRALQACGTEPTPPGIYSNYDITTLLPFHNYMYLCTIDPTSRMKTKPLPRPLDGSIPTSKLPLLNKIREIRHIPSFRYLAMLLHRCQQIHSITSSLLSHGHRLPVKQTPSVLAKLSFVLDLPLNNSRLALFRNEKFFSNTDLYVMMLFFVKLDMCFTDPVDGDGEVELRPLLLQQRSLKVMDDVLARRDARTIIEIMQIWVRTYYRPPPGREEEFRGMSVLGVPYEELGILSVEGWGQPVKPPTGPTSVDLQASSAPSSSTARVEHGDMTADVGTNATPPSFATASASTSNIEGSTGTSAAQPQPQSQHQSPAQPSQPATLPRQQQQQQQQPPPASTSRPTSATTSSTSNTTHQQTTPSITQPSHPNAPQNHPRSGAPQNLSGAPPHHPSTSTSHPATNSLNPPNAPMFSNSPRDTQQQAPVSQQPQPPPPPRSPQPPQPQPPPSLPTIPHEPWKRAHLLPPDHLLIGECIRRQLPLHQKVIDMILYGYLDVRTGKGLPRSEEERVGRREKELVLRREMEVEERWRSKLSEEAMEEKGGNGGMAEGSAGAGRAEDGVGDGDAREGAGGGMSEGKGKGKMKAKVEDVEDDADVEMGGDTMSPGIDGSGA